MWFKSRMILTSPVWGQVRFEARLFYKLVPHKVFMAMWNPNKSLPALQLFIFWKCWHPTEFAIPQVICSPTGHKVLTISPLFKDFPPLRSFSSPLLFPFNECSAPTDLWGPDSGSAVFDVSNLKSWSLGLIMGPYLLCFWTILSTSLHSHSIDRFWSPKACFEQRANTLDGKHSVYPNKGNTFRNGNELILDDTSKSAWDPVYFL